MKNTSFYIASRYLLARKGSTAVTFITWLSVLAMTVAVAAMFIIISVFSGLEDVSNDLIKDVHADLTIKSKVGKTLQDVSELENFLKTDNRIFAFSKIIEEKVYIEYDGKGEIAHLRGVDSNYLSVNPLQNSIVFGVYPSFAFENEVLMEYQLDSRLSIPTGPDSDAFATLYMPKAGLGLVTQETDIFNKKEIYVTGAFSGNDKLNNYIISPIELAQNLLHLRKEDAYQIVIKLEEESLSEEVRNHIEKKFNQKYIITTKKEENAAFWKMINIEKFFIYLIFGLVIFITTFNLAGAIIILQLDKKTQAKTLLSIGLSNRELRKIYFYTGTLIVFCGIMSGLMLGTIICLFQIQTEIFMASPTLPFPVRILGINYFIVISLASFFGLLVSWFFSKTYVSTRR